MLVVAIVLAVAAPAGAQSLSGLSYPAVPVSKLAAPMLSFDPSRLHVSMSVTMGTGFGGTSGLQVTSLSYQFRAPLWLQVSVGNAIGAGTSGRNTPFLEGMSLAWKPRSSMLFQFQYQDFRSPLQYTRAIPFATPGF